MKHIELYLNKLFFKDILGSRQRRRIKSNYELLKEVKLHYSTQMDREELEIRLIELERKKVKIKTGIDYTIIFSQISLMLTMFISIYNMQNTYRNQYDLKHENNISRLESNRHEIWMKAMEIDSKINLSRDIDEKEALTKYRESLMGEYNINGKNMINELDSLDFIFSNSYQNIFYIILIWIVIFIFFMISIDAKNTYKELKKESLEDRVKIIKQIIA